MILNAAVVAAQCAQRKTPQHQLHLLEEQSVQLPMCPVQFVRC
jgi:hypothetical protein